MYIGYVYDRKILKYSCIGDDNTGKRILDFTNFLKKTGKISVIYIVESRKQISVLIFSKKILISVFILVQCISVNVNPGMCCPLSSSSKVYQSFVSKSNNLRFLSYSSSVLDYILKLRSGFDELDSDKEKKLINSIIAKTDQGSYEETSFNKFLEKIFKSIESVITDQRFWKIVQKLQDPMQSTVSSEVESTDLLANSENGKHNHVKTRSKGSSTIFVKALPLPPEKTLSPMMQRVQLRMAQNNLQSSGLSNGHASLSQDSQVFEMKTRRRRMQPLYSSEVLGNNFQYSFEQLKRKAPRHLSDFNIPIEGKNTQQMCMQYKDFIEFLLSKSNLIIHRDGTLSKQEPAIIFGDPESLGIVAFEKNALYEENHFISCYPITKDAFDDFKKTGNVGLSPDERTKLRNESQNKKDQPQAERSFYSSLPNDARMSNKQLRQVYTIEKQLEENPNFSLTENQKNLMERFQNYRKHESEFYQNNPDIKKPDIGKDEL